MIHKKLERKSAVFENFRGMDASAPYDKGGCVRLENFRVKRDGSLEKREGFRHIATLPAAVRAAYPYRDGGEEVLLVVAGSYLCRIRKSDGAMQASSVFITSEGKALFFESEGVLYILDNESFYRYEGGVDVTAGDPYIPLIGEGWPTGTPEISAPRDELNLLSRRGLYTYFSGTSNLNGGFLRLYFDRPVLAVEHLYVGGEVCDPSNYSLSADRTYIQMKKSYYSYFKEIRAYVILSDEAPALSASRCFSYDIMTLSVRFLYGGADPSAIYRLKKVSDAETSALPYRTAFPLYVPPSEAYSLEDRRVTALLRMGKRILAFSDYDISVTKNEYFGGKLDFFPITGEVGCTAGAAMLLDDDNVLTVAKDGVYKVTPDIELKEGCRLRLLSSPVKEALGDRFYEGATLLALREEGELWFADPSGRGEVFLLRPEEGIWTVFCGIRADILLELFGDIAFVDGVFVGLFDKSAKADHAAYGVIPIEGRVQTACFDFGSPASDKRLSGFLALADLDGGEMEVRIADDGYLGEFTLSQGSPAFSHLYETDLRSGRFRLASLRLTATGEARTRIWRAQIFI